MNDSVFISKTSNNITLLRHAAAIFVIISHSFDLLHEAEYEPLSRLSAYTISFSRLGLIFFFFMSGFLTTQSLLESGNIKKYLIKRILRIYPALLVLILLTVFVLGPIFTTLPLSEYFSRSQTWEYLFGGSLIRLRFSLPGVFNDFAVNGSLWSLPIEFRFYLFLPLLLVIGVFKKRIYFLFFLALLLCLYLSFPFLKHTPFKQYFLPYINWTIFFFSGSFVFFIKDKLLLNFRIFVVLLLTWFCVKQFIIVGRLTELLCFTYLVLLIGFKAPLVLKNYFKDNDFSYSLYIYAFPIQKIIIEMFDFKLTPLLLIFLSLIVLIPFCFMSWNYVEKPFLKLKPKFS